jgi:hypothetical protein
METDRFDRLSRLAAGSTRRRFGRTLAVLGLLWGMGRWDGSDETAAKGKKNKRKKNKNKKPQSCAVGQVLCGSACFPECCPGSTRPCYTGPAGTQNVGVCRDGEQFCLAMGTWSSICGGQVTPSIEVCNGLDDDCDGVIDEGANVVLCNSTGHVCEEGRCCRPNGSFCGSNDASCCSGNCDNGMMVCLG